MSTVPTYLEGQGLPPGVAGVKCVAIGKLSGVMAPASTQQYLHKRSGQSDQLERTCCTNCPLHRYCMWLWYLTEVMVT